LQFCQQDDEETAVIHERPKSNDSGKKRGRPRKTKVGELDSMAQFSNGKSNGEMNGVYLHNILSNS
jgi:lysine-specific demethylase 3